MKKKIVALCLCVALAVVAIGGATLAYFTDTETATNTFAVGNVDITLTESEWDQNDTHKLVPGTTIAKNPTVTVVKGSEECYVRVLVTINKSGAWDTIFAKLKEEQPNLQITDLLVGYDSNNWACVKITKNTADNTRTYELRYKEAVDASAEAKAMPALFTAVKVPSTLTGDQIGTLEGFNIVIEAQAIQTATFANDDAAWAAFTK